MGNIVKFIKSHVSLNGKIIEVHCTSKSFYDLEGCMCEWYGYQHNIKSETEIHPKSMKNQCENDGREHDSKLMENIAKIELKTKPQKQI